MCSNSGEEVCSTCRGDGRVRCSGCRATGSVTEVFRGEVEIISRAAIIPAGPLDPLRTRAFTEHGEAAFVSSRLHDGSAADGGAYFEAVVPFSVALIQTSAESSTLAFVGDRPSAFVVSSPLRVAFEPFFTEAEKRLDGGLGAYVRWSQERSYAARLLHGGIRPTDVPALTLLVGRSTETLPSATTGALLDALVDPGLRRSFRDRLDRSLSGYSNRLQREASRIRKQRLALSATVGLVSMAAGVTVLAGPAIPWTLDMKTPVGLCACLLGLAGVLWVGLEAAHLRMAVAHFHERESARLDASADPGRFEGWHRLQRGSALAASIALAAGGVFLATEIRRVASHAPEPAIAAAGVSSVQPELIRTDIDQSEAKADLLPVGFVPPDMTDRASEYQVRQVMPGGVIFQCVSARDGLVRAFGAAPFGPEWIVPASTGLPEIRVPSYEAAVLQVCGAPVESPPAGEGPFDTPFPAEQRTAPAPVVTASRSEPADVIPVSPPPKPPPAPDVTAPRDLSGLY